jgi:hypothetical protein
VKSVASASQRVFKKQPLRRRNYWKVKMVPLGGLRSGPPREYCNIIEVDAEITMIQACPKRAA